MLVFKTKEALIVYLQNIKEQNKTIGFVPTMGALHQGHLSLVQKSQEDNTISVVSIFVNPTQFDNVEDLKKYPKTLQKDLDLLENQGCDVVYTPSVEDIYPANVVADSFDFDGLEHQMEGAFRDGHFDGVGTIIKTFLDILKPNKAYFGEKDYQQLLIIKKLVSKNNIPVTIVGCTIFREEDGLAMSSRNARLSEEHRKAAPFIYKTLKKANKKIKKLSPPEITLWVQNKFKKHPLLELEYFTIADQKTLLTADTKEENTKYRGFIAVYAGGIRLIDNIKLKNKK